MAGEVIFKEGEFVTYTLPPATSMSMTVLTTWVDHVSMNESVWRDFSDLKKAQRVHLMWMALTPTNLALLETFHALCVAGNSFLYYEDLAGTTWSVEGEPGAFDLGFTPYTGMLVAPGVSPGWGTLYQTTFVFRAISVSSYVLP